MIKKLPFNEQVKIVYSYIELMNETFAGQCNAICLQRSLSGNFDEIIEKLELKEDTTIITVEELRSIPLSKEGEFARSIILKDLQILTDFGCMPALNLIKNYERDQSFDFISTDVYSFHVDRSPIATDTFLCTYYGAPSEIIANDDADRKINLPHIRAKLKDLYDGADENFENFLEEYYFDLHYQAKPNAKPISLGIGNLWKLAVDHPTQAVPPCIHRAPKENEGEYRLLLIC